MSENMQSIDTIARLRSAVQEARRQGKSTGFVATMGFLHEGHLRLVQTAKSQHDIVIVSIFVNPLQFGPNEDFDAYPRNVDRDVQLLSEHGCDIVFTPSVAEMYPQPMETQVSLPQMSTRLCGRTRPTHFQGVATVVTKLLNIVQPDAAYFGQKDAQQVAIIRRMVKDLNMPVDIVAVPTVREDDGLAKSSRNVYLQGEQRQQATVLYRALQAGVEAMEAGGRDAQSVIDRIKEVFATQPEVRLDYAEVVDFDTLDPVQKLDGRILLAVAAYVGQARLIDNVPLAVGASGVQRL